MAVFSPLLDVLAEVPDPRRAEGKLYQLPHVLLFAILAVNRLGNGTPDWSAPLAVDSLVDLD